MKVKPRSLGRLLWPHTRPYAKLLVVVFVLGTVTALAQQASFLLIKPTWEILFPEEAAAQAALATPDVQPPGEGEPAFLAKLKADLNRLVLGEDPDLTDPDTRMSLLLRVCGIILVVTLLGAGTAYAFAMLSAWVAMRMVISLRMAVAEHLMGLSLRYHGKRKLGDLLSRVSADVGTAMVIVNTFMRDMIQQPLMAITALVAAFVLAPQATLLVVFGLPVLVIPIAILLRRIRRSSTKSLDQLGASVQILAQMFQGVRTVKAFRAEQRELRRYRDINERYLRTTMKMARASSLTRVWTILYTNVGLALVLLLLGWMALHSEPGDGMVSSSDLIPFFLFLSRSYTSIKITTRGWGRIAEAQGALDRLQALFDEQPDITEREGAVACTGLGSGVFLENVSFSYPDGDGRAIDGITLAIHPGETLALVGPSGAGKTTLVDILARFVDPTKGRVTVDGVDLRDLTLDSWTGCFSMVTQDPFLFHASILENIRYGKVDASREEIVGAARAANIHDFIEGLPLGYDTDVADTGSRLSGGQRQRLTIARAILHGGELLLLDEATSSLDTESETVVQAALDGLMTDRTVVVIAHRLSTIRNADRIAVLDGGRLVELGTHDELLQQDGLYARLHKLQFA